MKWFYLVIIAAAVAAVTIAVGRIYHTMGHIAVQTIVAASMAVLFIALIKFLTKLHD